MTENIQTKLIIGVVFTISIYTLINMDKNFFNFGNNNHDGIQTIIENPTFEQKTIEKLEQSGITIHGDVHGGINTDDGTINNTQVNVK